MCQSWHARASRRNFSHVLQPSPPLSPQPVTNHIAITLRKSTNEHEKNTTRPYPPDRIIIYLSTAREEYAEETTPVAFCSVMTHVQLEEHYFEEHADNGVMGNTSSAPDMDQAAMHYAAAAEQLLESEELGRKAGKRSKREKEVPGGTIKAIVVAATTALKERGEADGEGKRRKKKKKHGRQTSQEEESAQALLALNKGGVAGEEDDGEAPKKRKKKKSAKKDRAVSGEEEAVAEVEMLDLEPVEAPASVGYAVDNAVESGLQQQMEIPERVTAEHLAAHMAKSSELVVPVVEEQLDVGQRLINELQNHTNIIGGDGFVPVNPNLNGDGSLQMMASTTTGKTPKKRKRISDNNTTNITTPMPQPAIHASTIEQIDPQLMELDHATQMAASEMAGEKKRRRRANTAMGGVSPMEGDEDTDTPAKKTTRRKPSGENKPSWGTAPASGNGEAAPGGTFTLDERFAIDKALQDYCKVHSMTMDELRDRVWGNNRKKDVFWDSICNAVPNRSRASVYKHVRRSCHIFQQRAKWTADEDAELADMVKEKGNKWKDIGEAMGRMGEDCRDRYRNYVKCGKDRGTDRWSEEEEELLKKTVAEHKEITRQILLEQGKDLPPPEEEDTVLINWTTVSEKMQNKRSRIQCRYKWKKMQAQKEKVKAAPIGVTYVGGKKKRINFNIEDMTAGDRQWLLYQ